MNCDDITSSLGEQMCATNNQLSPVGVSTLNGRLSNETLDDHPSKSYIDIWNEYVDNSEGTGNIKCY